MDIREKLKVLLGLKKLPEGESFEGFSTEQLKEADAKAREVFSSARENKDLPTAEDALETVRAITAEVEKRTQEEAEMASKFEAMEAELSTDNGEGEGEGDEEGEGEGDEGGEQGGEEPVQAAADETATEPAPETPAAEVTASAPKPKIVPKPSTPPAEKPLARIIAGADIDGHSAGTPMTPAELGEAFANKARAVKGGRIGGRTTVAKIALQYGSDQIIDRDNDPEYAQEKIDLVVKEMREATRKNLKQIVASGRDTEQVMELAAAGGFCAPFTPRYDICQQGDDVRPLRDSLPTFQATRGGITYLTPPQLSDVDGAVNVYTEEQDASGYDYPKGCIRVDCGTPVTEKVQAITLCMEVGNFQRLSFPENFQAWWHYGQVAFARTAETELWDKMVTLSTARTAIAHGLGATRNTLVEMERYVQQMRYALRSVDPVRVWAPEWLKAVLRADLTNQFPGDSTLSVTDATLVQYLAARGIAITFVLDGQSPNSGDTDFPNTVQVIMALEGTFLRLDMGVLDFGTEIRDFTQIRQNDTGAFYEIFENVAKVCNGPQVITLPICPTGEASGQVTAGTVAC